MKRRSFFGWLTLAGLTPLIKESSGGEPFILTTTHDIREGVFRLFGFDKHGKIVGSEDVDGREYKESDGTISMDARTDHISTWRHPEIVRYDWIFLHA